MFELSQRRISICSSDFELQTELGSHKVIESRQSHITQGSQYYSPPCFKYDVKWADISKYVLTQHPTKRDLQQHEIRQLKLRKNTFNFDPFQPKRKKSTNSLSPNFKMKHDHRITTNRHKSKRYSKLYRDKRNTQKNQLDPVTNEFILMNKSCECLECGSYIKKDKLIFKHLYEDEERKKKPKNIQENEQKSEQNLDKKTQLKKKKWKFDGIFQKRYVQQHLDMKKIMLMRKKLSFIARRKPKFFENVESVSPAKSQKKPSQLKFQVFSRMLNNVIEGKKKLSSKKFSQILVTTSSHLESSCRKSSQQMRKFQYDTKNIHQLRTEPDVDTENDLGSPKANTRVLRLQVQGMKSSRDSFNVLSPVLIKQSLKQDEQTPFTSQHDSFRGKTRNSKMNISLSPLSEVFRKSSIINGKFQVKKVFNKNKNVLMSGQTSSSRLASTQRLEPPQNISKVPRFSKYSTQPYKLM